MSELNMLELLWACGAWLCIFVLPGWAAARILPQNSSDSSLGTAMVLSACVLIPLGLICGRFSALWLGLPLAALAAALLLLKSRGESASCSIKGADLAVVLVACILAVALHYGEIFISPAVRGGFFYLSEIKHFVLSMGLPRSVTHFGSEIVPQVDKFGFDILGAYYWMIGPADPLLLKRAGYLLTVLTGTACAFEFFRRLAPSPFAAAAALLLYADVWLGSAVTLRAFFIPESLAVIFLLASFRLVFMERARGSSAVPAALALAACAVCHLEIACIAGLFAACVYLCDSLKLRSVKPLQTLALVASLSGGAAALCYALLGQAPEFVGTAAKSLPTRDVSWDYFPASDMNLRSLPLPGSQGAAEVFLQIFWENGLLFRNGLGAAAALFFFVTASGACFLGLRREACRDDRLPALFGFAAALQVLCLLALAFACNAYFDTWIYRTEVLRRLIPYLSVFLLITFTAALALISRRAASKGLRSGLSFLCLLVALAAYGASFRYMLPVKSPYTMSSEAVETARWLKENTAPGEKILSNTASNGAFFVLANRISITEGHQPMLRPSLVAQTVELLEQARLFFEQPEENFLTERGVEYVVVSRGTADFGGTRFVEPFSKERRPRFLCPAYSAGHIEVYRRCISAQNEDGI